MATRYIYLSDELNNKLKKEPNASKLISDLLIKYYEGLDFNNLTLDQLQQMLVEAESKKKAEEELKELELKMKVLKDAIN